MKQNILKTATVSISALVIVLALITGSCNKALPDATPIIYPPVNNNNTTIGTLLDTDTSFSIFKSAAAKLNAAIKVDLIAKLSDTNSVFTVFIPNNAAFRASGFPNWDAVNAFLPLSSLAAILQYAIIPGEQITSTDVPVTFPNMQLPTLVNIGVLPAPAPPVKVQLSAFLSRTDHYFYDNTIPVLQPDIKMKNGIIHLVGGIVAPPSQVLRDAIYSDPGLSYFKAAIARADSNETGLNRFDSLLNYAATNMTVLVPDNAAFQTLISGLAFQNYLSTRPTPYTAMDTAIATATASGAVAAGPAFLSTNYITTAQVKAILAYHFLATKPDTAFLPNVRVFSNNFAEAPGAFYTTLVNTSVPPSVQPGVMARATFTGPFVSSLVFAGAGTLPSGGAHYSQFATAVSKDHLAVNGIYHVIDKVLLPQ